MPTQLPFSRHDDGQPGVDRQTRFLCKRPGSCGSWAEIQGVCFVKALRPVPPIRVIYTLPDVLANPIFEREGPERAKPAKFGFLERMPAWSFRFKLRHP